MANINEQLKAAMAELAASDEAPPLAPSKLGTKDHWVSTHTGQSQAKSMLTSVWGVQDAVYEREVKTFAEIGDEGEVSAGLEGGWPGWVGKADWLIADWWDG